jgi:putative CRISPR-associated protein (TIGR02619 family)
MGRTILTTCGTSLLTTGCWSIPTEPDLKSYQGLSEEDRALQEIYNKRIISKLIVDAPNLLIKNFNMSSWTDMIRDDLSAELASLRVLQEALHLKENITLGTGDKIILLHSTNYEGQACANVLRKLLKDKLFPNVEILEPEAIEDLDPADLHNFGIALKTIWGKFCNIRLADDEKIIFNLTGGYKAILMVLSGVCALASAPVTIAYLHETAKNDGLFVMNFRGNNHEDRLRTGYGDRDDRYRGCEGI